MLFLLVAGCTETRDAVTAWFGGGAPPGPPANTATPSPTTETRARTLEQPNAAASVVAFWQSVHAGALATANDLGVEIIWLGAGPEESRLSMVGRGVRALMLTRLDGELFGFVTTTREGLPVVIFDLGNQLDWDGPTSILATDNYQGGVLAAERMNELLRGSGTCLVMRNQGSASTNRREAGFLDTMRERFTGIEVVGHNQNGRHMTAENLLVNHPEVGGIFTPSESTTTEMLRALTDADRVGVTTFVGSDVNENLVDALRDGRIHSLIVQNPVRMGELAVRIAVAHLGSEPVTHIEARVDIEATMVTRENMEEAEFAALLKPDLSILARIN